MDIPPLTATGQSPRAADLATRQAAQAFETAFLAEMLSAAGMARMPTGLDDGQRDEHFSAFMAEAQARALVAAGGLGLTGAIARALADRRQDAAE